jgi:hypothetical protein
MIADMHRRFRTHATALQRLVEQSRIRLGDADVFGAQRKLEVIRQPRRRTSALPLVTTPRV